VTDRNEEGVIQADENVAPRRYVSVYMLPDVYQAVDNFVNQTRSKFPGVKFSRSVLFSNAIVKYLKANPDGAPKEDLHHPILGG